MKILFGVFLSGIFFITKIHSQDTREEAIAIARTFGYERFFHHMEVLSADSMEGRAPGTPGYNRAASYIEKSISEMGLIPLGDHGSYFQMIPFETRLIEENSVKLKFLTDSESLSALYGRNITILPGSKAREISLAAEMVFVGYGLEIPELSINNFEGIDVKDKVVLVSFGIPEGFDKTKYRSSIDPFEKIKVLQQKGAAGVIFFSKPGILQNLLFKALHKFLRDPWFDFQETDISNPMVDSGLQLLGYAKKDLIKELLLKNSVELNEIFKSMEENTFRPFNLKSVCNCSYTVKKEPFECKNIVAMIPGNDPVYSQEYLVLSAHLDHLGIGKPIKKDSVYNGAWDNASGSSTLLEIANAYKKMRVPPGRSVIFLWVTAEEKGLMGSHYFAAKPTVPKDKIVAAMTLDMPGGHYDFKDIIPMGYKMSNLSDGIDFATTSLSLESDTLSSLEDEFFERSDHFSFIQEGIPALFVISGTNATDPDIKGEKMFRKWEKKVYHKPADESDQEFNKNAFLKGIQTAFLTSWYIASEMDKIQWKQNSNQYKKYKPELKIP